MPLALYEGPGLRRRAAAACAEAQVNRNLALSAKFHISKNQTLVQSTAKTVSGYLAELTPERRTAISAMRRVIKQNLPKGFVEEMGYGMIGYVVPHSLYPGGYHCNPKQPLPFMGLASQKNYLALYHMGIYASEPLLDWFRKEYKKTGKKLNMGKGCIRFVNLAAVPLDLIGQLAKKITVKQYIAQYSKIDPRNTQKR